LAQLNDHEDPVIAEAARWALEKLETLQRKSQGQPLAPT
jgi:hypothetical protein